MKTTVEFVAPYLEVRQARDNGDPAFQWRIDLESVLRSTANVWPAHQNVWEVRARVKLVNQFLRAYPDNHETSSVCRVFEHQAVIRIGS